MAFSFLLLAFYACTERELHGIRPLDTGISIRTSWGDIVHGDAETLEFHFYPADGSTPIVESAVPSGGFEGKLPVGKYKVLAFNSETANVETVDMDSYEKAAVIAKSAVTVRSGENMRLAEPGPVYAFRGEIEVVEGALSVYTVMADPLTQDIGMQVTNNTDLAIVSVRCDFPGIVLGRYLSRTRDKEPYHQESMGIYPAEAAFNNRIAEIGFRSFGVFSPAVSGLSETPIVLTLKLDDGRAIETEVAGFGKLLDEAVGDREFPAGLKLDMELKLAADGTGDIFVGIGIQGWKDYDGDGMPDKIGRNGKEILY